MTNQPARRACASPTSNNAKSAGRLKHALRRFAVLQRRIKDGEVKVEHVPDKHNAADFLTKWVSAKKVKQSVAYVSNVAAKQSG